MAVSLGLAIEREGRFFDSASGRPITSHLAALATLPLTWGSPAGRTWLRTVWTALVSSPRRQVQAWARWLRGRHHACTPPHTRSPERLTA